MSRFLPLLQRFLLLAILLFAAGFCWVQRDTLAQAAQLTLWQAAFVFTGYFACYCLNALMACQVQWSRGTRPRLWEMLVINSYASLLGYATVMRAGYYGGKVWFYQLDPGRNMGKTNPLNDADLADFIDRQRTFADSAKSWSVDVADIDPKTFDLSVKNPNGGEEITHRSPQEIMEEIAALDAESAEVLGNIKQLLNTDNSHA